MWWYRAPAHTAARRIDGRPRRRAGRGLRHRRPARPAACGTPRPRPGRRGMVRARRAGEPPPSPARRSSAAAPTRCRSPMPASTRRSPPTCCAIARWIRRRACGTDAAFCVRAVGSSSTCRPMRGCSRRMTGRCTMSAAQTANQLDAPCCARPDFARCARATGTACCCRSWWCSASCWPATAPPRMSPRFRHGSMRTLHAMTEIERHLPFALPAGGSVLATAERP